jgi:hypothetical protein
MTLASFNIHSFIKLKFKLVWAGVLLVLASVVPQLEFAHAESSVVWRDSRFIFVSDSVSVLNSIMPFLFCSLLFVSAKLMVHYQHAAALTSIFFIR